MKRPEQLETVQEREWHSRLSELRQHPAPNLERGRARVLTAAQARFAKTPAPRRAPLVFSFGVGLGVILVMVVMSGAMGGLPITRVALTRTETLPTHDSATIMAPSSHSESPESAGSLDRFGTPVPGAAPEPPRSPSLSFTLTLEP